nr:PREDICTED: chromatin assembly factor 1 subunit A isoform X1 [Lepisosteus oculatus]
MLAAEELSSEGPLAQTPRRRGMEGKTKSSSAAKKLVQARLPFKRLNPVPKQNGEPKRTRGPPAPPSPEGSASDTENEQDRSPLPVPPRSAILVNGRGPLDGFMSRARRVTAPPEPCVTIDLTEDSNSAPAPDTAPSPALAQDTAPAGGSITPTSMPEPHSTTASMETGPLDSQTGGGAIDSVAEVEKKVEEEEEEVGVDKGASPSSQPACTQDPDHSEHPQALEAEAEVEGEEESVSGPENESLLSPSSSSSLSAVESSPEPAKGGTPLRAEAPGSTGPKTPQATEDKKVKRRSLKGEEQEQRRRQREEQRAEREQQRSEARAARERAKEEARRRREEKERDKREKKEKEEKEKAEKLRAKEEQRKVKLEAKLEEKRKKEEEKRLKEEKDRIKAEKAEITRFLQKPKTLQVPKTLAAACGKFAPFEIKENMVLAPLSRVQCEEEALEQLDRYLAEPDHSLDCRRHWLSCKHRRSGPTWPRPTEDVNSCVLVVEVPKPDGVPDRRQWSRMKLLQFHENYRPAYWGTWSKRSRLISPRCPLQQDKELLDYDVDSDEEWEEEEPGESLSHSEGDEEEEGGDEDDDDDGFFVPHGYLSEGEGASEEEERADPENQKVRQRLKAREWDELMSKGKKFHVLEPVVLGCVWEAQGEPDRPENRMLRLHAVCLLDVPPGDEAGSPESSARERRDEQILSQLLPLLHGNTHGSKVIIMEFQECCRRRPPPQPTSPEPGDDGSVPTRYRLKRIISENAVYEKRPAWRRCCWYVHQEVLQRFGQEGLPVPCQWSYLTQGPHSAREESNGTPSNSSVSPPTPVSTAPPLMSSSAKRKSAGSMSITRFMKRCGDAEQGEAMETDGFQADTEEDEDDADCVIVEAHTGSVGDGAQQESTEHMEVTTSDLPAAAATPSSA